MSKFNTLINWAQCSDDQRSALLMRPAISASDITTRTVREILDNVQANGDQALREYSAHFDKIEVDALRVSAAQIAAVSTRLGEEIKQAIAVAIANVETFHHAQQLPRVDIETQPGVRCQQVTRPIDSGRAVYSRRLGPATLHRIDAGDTGAHRWLPPGGAMLAAADCR